MAEDSRLKRRVALKVLPPEFAASAERLERFQREAQALARLQHPNIVAIHSVEHADDIHFLTMELVEGRRLGELIPSGGLPLERFFDLAVPLVEGVAAAHEQGVVHRDLKPSNVLVDRNGTVKVLDFGLAKLGVDEGISTDAAGRTAETLTDPGRVLGTLAYMSPEQVRGQPVDHQSDIFSLGVILHEMATGERPFAGASSMDVASAILTQDPRQVPELREDLPFHLGRIVRRCLAKDVEHRYRATQDLREDLAALGGEVASGQVRTSTLTDELEPVRAGRWPGRLLTVLAVLAGLGLAGLAFWTLSARQDRAPAGYDVLAVLPFQNLTGDANQDYLGEGLGAALIAQLTNAGGLSVLSRSEAWSFEREGLSPTELGKKLGVAAIVGGEFHREPNGLRVDVHLADAGNGVVLWSESYHGARDGMAALQGSMARDLARFVSVPLSWSERRRLAREPTGSARAYDLYLQAHQFLETVDRPRSLEFARDLFREAVRTDPDFALAEAGLTEASLRLFERSKDPSWLAEAERSANRALELDASLPAALLGMAKVLRASGRYAESLAELRSLLARHPRPDEAHRELAFAYEEAGDLAAAESSLRTAVALRSDHWFHWNSLGGFLVRKGDYPGARAAFEEAADLAPEGIGWPHWNLAAVYLREADFKGAIAAYEALDHPIEDARLAGNIGTAYYFADRLDKAEEFYRLAVRLEPADPIKHGNLADLLLRRGETHAAHASYRRAMELVEAALERTPQSNELRVSRALYAAKAGECAVATELASGLKAELPPTGQNFHDRALVHALCGEDGEALEALGQAISLGVSADLIRQEDEFRRFHATEAFERLTAAGTP